MPRHSSSSTTTGAVVQPPPVFADPSQNPLSVYYLHPNENSTNALVAAYIKELSCLGEIDEKSFDEQEQDQFY